MRRTRTLAITAICTLTLATACTESNEPGATPTTSTPAANESSTPPSEPQPPELPAAAHHKTTAGAKAFITYYIKVLDYSYRIPTPRALETLSPDSCHLCQTFLTVTRRLARDGGLQTGGELITKRITLIARESPGSLVLIATVDVSKGTSRGSATDTPKPITPASTQLEVHTIWADGAWTLENVRQA